MAKTAEPPLYVASQTLTIIEVSPIQKSEPSGPRFQLRALMRVRLALLKTNSAKHVLSLTRLYLVFENKTHSPRRLNT